MSALYGFKKESFSDTFPELKSLFKQNHAETSALNDPLDPDYLRLSEMERAGNLLFYVIRYQGEAVGYAMFYLDEEIRHKGVWSAVQEMMFVEKKHRGIGIAFITYCDAMLKEMGVKYVWRQATTKLDVGRVYEHLGYELIQKTYLKGL